MKLKLTNEQKLILSQKMQQSLKLLQMNSHELETYLNELSMENPLIEVVPPREMPPSHEKQFSARTTTDPDIMSRTIADTPHNTLYDSVKEQINYLRIPELLRRELIWLADEMNERGYLPKEEPELYAFGGSIERYENAVKVFQSLEPAGVGARTLGECLLIQLRRRGAEDDISREICLSYLDRLARSLQALSRTRQTAITAESRRCISAPMLKSCRITTDWRSPLPTDICRHTA